MHGIRLPSHAQTTNPPACTAGPAHRQPCQPRPTEHGSPPQPSQPLGPAGPTQPKTSQPGPSCRPTTRPKLSLPAQPSPAIMALPNTFQRSTTQHCSRAHQLSPALPSQSCPALASLGAQTGPAQGSGSSHAQHGKRGTPIPRKPSPAEACPVSHAKPCSAMSGPAQLSPAQHCSTPSKE